MQCKAARSVKYQECINRLGDVYYLVTIIYMYLALYAICYTVFCKKKNNDVLLYFLLVQFTHKRGFHPLSPWWCHHGNVDSVSIGNRRSQWYMTNTAGAHRPGGVGVSPCSFSQSRFQSSNIPLTTKYPVRKLKKNKKKHEMLAWLLMQTTWLQNIETKKTKLNNPYYKETLE